MVEITQNNNQVNTPNCLTWLSNI